MTTIPTQDMAPLGTVRDRDSFVMVKLQVVMGERGLCSTLCYSKSPCSYSKLPCTVKCFLSIVAYLLRSLNFKRCPQKGASNVRRDT